MEPGAWKGQSHPGPDWDNTFNNYSRRGGISGQKEDRQTGSGESGFAAFFDVAGLPVARILRVRIGLRAESCSLLGTASKTGLDATIGG